MTTSLARIWRGVIDCTYRLWSATAKGAMGLRHAQFPARADTETQTNAQPRQMGAPRVVRARSLDQVWMNMVCNTAASGYKVSTMCASLAHASISAERRDSKGRWTPSPR